MSVRHRMRQFRHLYQGSPRHDLRFCISGPPRASDSTLPVDDYGEDDCDRGEDHCNLKAADVRMRLLNVYISNLLGTTQESILARFAALQPVRGWRWRPLDEEDHKSMMRNSKLKDIEKKHGL